MAHHRCLSPDQFELPGLFNPSIGTCEAAQPAPPVIAATPPNGDEAGEEPSAPCAVVPAPPAPATLAELAQRVASSTHLTLQARRDVQSAINRTAQILGLPASAARCDIRWLNERLFEHPPAAYRLGGSAFKELVSRLRRALRLAGLHAEYFYGEAGLGAAWHDFLAQVVVMPRRAGLRGLARFADGHGIAPHAVDDAVLARFIEHDSAHRLGSNIIGQGPRLAVAWNKAVQQQPATQRYQRLRAPQRRIAYTQPIETLPQSFQDDLATFVARFQPLIARGAQFGASSDTRRVMLSAMNPWTMPVAIDGRRPPRRLRPWRPATHDSRVFSIRQAAAALLASGTQREALTNLAVLVQPVSNAHTILSFYLGRANGAPGSQREAIAKVLMLIARHHVAVPDADLDQLAAWYSELKAPRQFEMGRKARECLRRLAAPRARAILLALPEHLAVLARQNTLKPIEQARYMRAAVIIELLLRCPMRLSNLEHLHLKQHVLRLDGPRRVTHLAIEAFETKNNEPLSFPLPRASADLLQRYLDDYRPILAEPDNMFVFPGQGQNPLSSDQLRADFQAKVEGATGVQVYPHIMRAFAGLIFLEAHPGQYETLRRILGHKDIETTIRHYTGLERESAFKMSDQALLAQRHATRALAAQALRPKGRVSSRRKA